MASQSKFTKNLNEAYLKGGGKGSSFVRTLAAQVNVTPTTIHKLLGGSEPGLELSLAVAKKLGFTLKEMLGDELPVARPAPKPLEEMQLKAIALILAAREENVILAIDVLESGAAKSSTAASHKRKPSAG